MHADTALPAFDLGPCSASSARTRQSISIRQAAWRFIVSEGVHAEPVLGVQSQLLREAVLLMAELRQSIHFTTSFDGVRLAYAVAGKGPPLVRAPTWLTHVEYDWVNPMSRHWMSEFSTRHTFVRLDPRGAGMSEWNVADISFEAIVRDLEAVVDAVGLERFAMLGTSMGAAVAIAYAARHPERVSRLFLWGSFCRGPSKRGSRAEQLERVQLLIKLVELGWGTDDPAFRQVFASQLAPGGTKEQWSWFTDKMRLSMTAHNAARYLGVTSAIDVCDLARAVRAPTLVLHSRRDARVPYAEGKLTASLIPGAEFVTLESENHILLATEPAWQKLVDELHRFLPTEAPAVPAGTCIDFEGLSPRERQVLELIAQGLGNDDIATRLFVSPKTVANHITSVFAKVGVNSRAQAIVRSREAGFGRSPTPVR